MNCGLEYGLEYAIFDERPIGTRRKMRLMILILIQILWIECSNDRAGFVSLRFLFDFGYLGVAYFAK